MPAPDVGVTAATLIAAAQIPAKLLARRIANAEERRTVERIYDELLATGTVERNLPEDDRMVRALYAQEVLAARSPQPQVSKVFPFRPRERVVTRIDQARAARRVQEPSAEVIPLRAPAPAPAAALTPADAVETAAASAAPRISNVTHAPMLSIVPATQPADGMAVRTPRPRSGLTDRLERIPIVAATRREDEPPVEPEVAAAVASPRFYLTLDQDVVDGPSIGPKTAERLHPHGIRTVRDLIKADPAALAVLVNARHITPEIVSGWQDQARLVCTVPGLRGTQAQLLVGAGYRSAEAIAAAEPDKLCADVLAFAGSAVGQRLLRNGDPPDIEKIKGWLEAARSMQAA